MSNESEIEKEPGKLGEAPEIFNASQNNIQVEQTVKKSSEKVSEISSGTNENNMDIIGKNQDINKKNNSDLSRNLLEKYRLIVFSTSDLISFTTFDISPIFTFVSPSHKKILGFEAEELLGKSWLDFIHEEDRPQIMTILLSYIDAKINGVLTTDMVENAPKLDFRFRDKSGQWHFLHSTVDIVNNELLFISKDITEQKRMEAELHKSHELFSKAFQSSPEIITITSMKEGRYIDVNESFLHTTGFRRDEVIGHTATELNIWVDLNDRVRFIQGLKEQGSIRNLEVCTRKKTGEIDFVLISSEIIDIKGESCVLTITTNITERKRIEIKLQEKINQWQKSELATLNIMEDLQKTIVDLQKAKEEIKQKHKELETINQELNVTRDQLAILNQDLEAKVQKRTAEVEMLLKQKDEFINQLGHDLKTPLTPLNALLPLMRQQEHDPKFQELLDVCISNVNYMRNLVIRTLELAQLNSPSTVLNIDNIALVDEVNEVLKRKQLIFVDHNITVNNNITNKLIVQADSVLIKELFDNIIVNAVKYSIPLERLQITIDAKEEEDQVVVSIKDTGIGLSSGQLDHIFHEFYKADSSRHNLESTGLGLSICKRIVEIHGGKIWAESPGLGKGSTFYFSLPFNKKKTV